MPDLVHLCARMRPVLRGKMLSGAKIRASVHTLKGVPGFLQYRADLGCRCRGSAPVALMHGFRFASPVSCPSWLSEHAWASPGFASERSPNLHDTSLLYITSHCNRRRADADLKRF